MTLDRRGLLATGLLLALGGCVQGPGGVLLIRGQDPSSELEPLQAVRAGPVGVTFRVASRGCTTKADFVFYLDRKDGLPRIAFARKRLDVCSGSAESQAEITFSYDELGVTNHGKLVVLNPL